MTGDPTTRKTSAMEGVDEWSVWTKATKRGNGAPPERWAWCRVIGHSPRRDLAASDHTFVSESDGQMCLERGD